MMRFKQSRIAEVGLFSSLRHESLPNLRYKQFLHEVLWKQTGSAL